MSSPPVVSAQLPEPPESDDRVYVLDSAVIVLDGASAVDPREVPTGTYVDTLGAQLIHGLANSRASLTDVLGAAIEETAGLLALRRGESPSSTVAIARTDGAALDVLVLGDSQVVTPARTIRDDRLACIATEERAAYRRRLARGAGYDEHHRELLRALQAEQQRHRNRPGGFWIAEADPRAAAQALTSRIPLYAAPWVALATDGAYRPAEQFDTNIWPKIATATARQLRDLLDDWHRWESIADPKGILLPRAKRHDDKTVAILRHTPIDSPPGA